MEKQEDVELRLERQKIDNVWKQVNDKILLLGESEKKIITLREEVAQTLVLTSQLRKGVQNLSGSLLHK